MRMKKKRRGTVNGEGRREKEEKKKDRIRERAREKSSWRDFGIGEG